MGRRFVLVAVGAVALVAGVTTAGAVGQDPGLPQQWGLAKIGAPSAWGRSIGAGVPIAIVDTGVDLAHDDLKGQIMARVTCVDTDGEASGCKVDGADIEGHGTHVAGIAAAAANNVGVSGVAPGARIIAVRVFGSTPDPVTGDYTAKSSDVEAGIRWVIANSPTKGAINLSLGGDFVVTNVQGASFAAAVEDAWKAGWVTVLAAGNDRLVGVESANYRNLDALVVGATGPDDAEAYYSNAIGEAKWGLVAPGGNARGRDCEAATCILSTFKGNGYALSEGTSMATPHVAGAVALLMSGGMTNTQAVQRILDTANKSVACRPNCHGRLDVNNAVPAEWRVAGSSTSTTVAGGGGGGGTATTAAGSSGSSATTARSTSSGGTSSPRPRASSAAPSTVVVAPPDLVAPAETVVETTTTSVASDDDETSNAAAPPSPDSRSDDGGAPAALVVFASCALAAVGVGATRETRRARGGPGRRTFRLRGRR